MRELYILAGQSNMSGRGNLSELPVFQNASGVWIYKNNGVWQNPGQEPTDSASGETFSALIDSSAAASCAMSFADAMVPLRNCEIGIVMSAKGGSGINEWKRDWDVRSLYGAMLMRTRAALEQTPGAQIKGFIWY
jgi:hypothetical protein